MVNIFSGIRCIDSGLGGGISPESVTLIYGEPETGKSTVAMQCAVNCAAQGFKVLFVDCDNTFSAKRLSQLSGEKFDAVADQVILVKPKNFREQAALVDRIQDYTAKGFGLIVVDTFTGLYGAQVAELPKAFSVNRELNRQLALLAQTAKIRKIPVVITSQVRAVLDNPNINVAPVATRVLTFWADHIIALKPTEASQFVTAVIEKTGENTQPSTCHVQIGESGLTDSELPR